MATSGFKRFERVRNIYRSGARLLGELFSLVIENEGNMHVAGRRSSKRLREENLARRIVNEVGAAHDVGDARKNIVRDDCKLIGPESVGTLQNEVAYFMFDILREVSETPVMEGKNAGRHAESERPDGFAVSALTAGSWIDPFGKTEAKVFCKDFLSRAGAAIDEAKFLKALERLFIGGITIVLPENGFVRLHSEALQIFNEAFSRSGDVPRGVNILNPQKPGSLVRAGIEPARQRCGKASGMELAGGRGSKATAIHGVFSLRY